jgi:signal transduction histidine kinase/CheY-like chemotaxis protein
MQVLRARLAFLDAGTSVRIAEAVAALDIDLDLRALDQAEALTDLHTLHLLFLEQHGPIDEISPRIYSIAWANPDLMIAVVVREHRPEDDRTLLQTGAFDVLDPGPHMEARLVHTVAAARRVVALQEERSRLGAELAQRNKLSALGVLAAGVSHEINNPCAAILSNISVVRDQLEALLARPRFQRVNSLDAFASDWIEALGDCVNAANRIHNIVKTLNVFSRKSDSAASIPTDINEEIRTVMRLIAKEIRFHAEIEVDLSPDFPLILAPPNSVTQIVTNLVVNALQAMEGASEPPRLSIATQFDDNQVMLQVADNGPGIPPEAINFIFDPFFTTKAIGKGTGLGLSITQELVRKLGGEIFAESTLGKGACFSVVIERTEMVRASARNNDYLPPITERLRVLLLDDDELILRSMHRSLSPHFECQTSVDARKALSLLESDGEFDAVVSDVVMPEMNGLEFWTHLGLSHPNLALRTVFISGGITSEALRVRVTDTGRPCLLKPVDMSELIRTIRRVGRPFDQRQR